MAHARDDMVKLAIILPPEEHEAFERWALFGARPKLSMTAAARELFRMAASGHVTVDRDRAKRLSRSAPPAKRPKRPSPPPAPPPAKRRG